MGSRYTSSFENTSHNYHETFLNQATRDEHVSFGSRMLKMIRLKSKALTLFGSEATHKLLWPQSLHHLRSLPVAWLTANDNPQLHKLQGLPWPFLDQL